MVAIVNPAGPDLETLWRDHARSLIRFATLLVGTYDADDVAVDAFLGAAPRVLQIEVADERRYLLGAVAKTAASAHRSQRRRRRRDLHAVLPEPAGRDDLGADVRRAVAGLSVAQRAAVYFAYWEDLPEREVAAVLGVSVGTVHRNLARARLRLRKVLR